VCAGVVIAGEVDATLGVLQFVQSSESGLYKRKVEFYSLEISWTHFYQRFCETDLHKSLKGLTQHTGISGRAAFLSNYSIKKCQSV